MKFTLFKKKQLKILFIIGFFLFLGSLFAFYAPYISPKFTHPENMYVYRAVRALASVIFLLFIIFNRKDTRFSAVFLFFVFYTLANIVSTWYEENILATSAMFFMVLSYLVLIIALIKKIDFKRINLLFGILFFFMVIINGIIIYELILSFKIMTLSDLHYFFMVLSGIFAVALCFFMLLYNHQYNTSATAIFLLFVLLIFFSEIFRGIAYYNIAYGPVGVFTARLLLILGLITGVNYYFLQKENEEKLYL